MRKKKDKTKEKRERKKMRYITGKEKEKGDREI